MVRVVGHWRGRSWVRTHYRHPVRPEADQTVLVLPPARVVRIDLSAHGGPFPAEPVDARPGPVLPAPRPPADDGS
ncbi:hypothetical protein H7X46_05410 [Pseudonocardia sp. C8]|uniref:hypothetical protein n=1 Tax=Pseudonocardia sp. C8 TaxID=2762759 RepID=UPI00164359AB|nr:hypothetical protein [Pseudonocardia sp. C8]MBC3190500.1 hypothetical protein [Pseudonocardia sp. C8]